GRFGVAGYIGERLLEDPERVARVLVGQPRELLGEVELDGDAGAARRVLDQVLDRGLEAELVEHAGAQLARDAAHDLHRFVDASRDRQIDGAELPGRAGALWGLLPEPRQVEFQRGERLAELVVNLARDAGPLFLADRLQPRRQRPQLLARLLQLLRGTGAVGDVALDPEVPRDPALGVVETHVVAFDPHR